MMIEDLPGMQGASSSPEISAFLDAFERNCESFAQACASYTRQEVGISDITRLLSEATAEAELKFGEYSFSMNLDQLQRYGVLQARIDQLTCDLFATEIQRNQAIILEALRNGEYFIIGLTYNSIKSSIYMMYSKQKIKTEQEQRLSALDSELEATQVRIKVLKAVESVTRIADIALIDYHKIQKALEIYVSYFRQTEPLATAVACDQRLFRLFEEHVEFLRNMGFGGDQAMASVHISICCDTLQQLAHDERQRTLLAAWRSLVSF